MANGSCYKGEWKDGSLIQGNVTSVDADGNSWEGEMSNEKFTGKGNLVFKDGTRIEELTDLKNPDGKVCGKGILKKQDGSVYEGELVDF